MQPGSIQVFTITASNKLEDDSLHKLNWNGKQNFPYVYLLYRNQWKKLEFFKLISHQIPPSRFWYKWFTAKDVLSLLILRKCFENRDLLKDTDKSEPHRENWWRMVFQTIQDLEAVTRNHRHKKNSVINGSFLPPPRIRKNNFVTMNRTECQLEDDIHILIYNTILIPLFFHFSTIHGAFDGSVGAT